MTDGEKKERLEHDSPVLNRAAAIPEPTATATLVGERDSNALDEYGSVGAHRRSIEFGGHDVYPP